MLVCESVFNVLFVLNAGVYMILMETSDAHSLCSVAELEDNTHFLLICLQCLQQCTLYNTNLAHVCQRESEVKHGMCQKGHGHLFL